MNGLASENQISTELALDYESKADANLPHVIKFSGGRSSGMMLMQLLQQGKLIRSRGDVVIFNNTSAEHPATYQFVHRCKEVCEQTYGIPFFWIEFATVEDAVQGDWGRISTYRMVNSRPISDSNPSGYHHQGEVFEELVSDKSFLPSRHNRICTTHLKVETTVRFLEEWFTGNEFNQHRGHHRSTEQSSNYSIVKRHRRSRGKQSDEDLLRKKEFVRSRPLSRAPQRFSDYSIGSFPVRLNSQEEKTRNRDRIALSGPDAFRYVSLMGLRADEPLRVARVRKRAEEGTVRSSRKGEKEIQGERLLMPLADSEVTKQDVLEFWRTQAFQLRLPEDGNLSNCVYCFMKGTRAIPKIREHVQLVDERLPAELRHQQNSPSDIDWWVDLEENYSREAKRTKKDDSLNSSELVRIGFWGADSGDSYKALRHVAPNDVIALEGPNIQPCDCTD